ncbi:MAG: TIGR03936 family radical SAM-associated protein, partial [Eubacteriales bacterium]|nr:TIGR03936 family radical SAM-associated protein [Eubacteriales bacterium]
MVRVAFRFCKEGDLAYISHLDLQRTMHRAVKRAQLPVEYSKGFHALPLVSFAHALGVGCTSEGECMEIVLKD